MGFRPVTMAAALVARLDFAYRAASLHVALETTAAITATAAAFLLLGRYRRTGFLEELLLSAGLSLLAVANFTFAALPAAFHLSMNRGAVWAMLFTSLLSSVLICLGALLPSRRVRAGARWPLTVYGATAAVAVVGTVPMVVFPGMLPHPDLRHTFASLLIAGGANITFLSRQLGHSSSQITLTVYAHLLDGEAQAERTREMLQEMLGDVV